MAKNPTKKIRAPAPVRSTIKGAKEYERAVRKEYLDPMISKIDQRMKTVTSAQEASRVLQDEIKEYVNQPPKNVIKSHVEWMTKYNKEKTISAFRSAFKLDIRPLLQDATIKPFMEERIKENVSLVKTIPQKMHNSLQAKISKEFFAEPFDMEKMKGMLQKDFKSSGYNLRRLTRDQDNKMNGQFTQIRQKQLQIKRFTWITSQDERVRPEHVARSGITYDWDDPPDGEIPGSPIQCRCVAKAVVLKEDRQRLQDNAPLNGPTPPHSIVDGSSTTPKSKPKSAHKPKPKQWNTSDDSYRTTGGLKDGKIHQDELVGVGKPTKDSKSWRENHPDALAEFNRQSRWKKKPVPDTDEYEKYQSAEMYRGSLYKKINKELRTDKIDEYKKVIEDIDKTFVPIDKTMQTRRSLHFRTDRLYDDEKIFIEKIKKLKPGDEFQDKAYFSTSTNGKTVEDFISFSERRLTNNDFRVYIEVEMPKGQKAIVFNERELEYLLPRGTKFEIVEVHNNVPWTHPLYKDGQIVDKVIRMRAKVD